MARTFSRHVPRGIGLVLQVGLALLALGSPTFAQENGTPAESKAGTATASTYAADKIETVNLANGNLSINVPLVTIGGRGSASHTLSLSYNSKVWSADHEIEDGGIGPFGEPEPDVHHYYAFYDNAGMARPNAFSFGGGWAVSLGPAVSARLVKIDPHACSSGHGTCFRYLLTKVNLILPDGSEIEMRDALTDGAPYYTGSSSTATDRDRGRVWKSSDGSAVTYVTDAVNGAVNGQYAGWVFLPDGTRLRMESFLFGTSARCTKIIDRNGNFVTIDYENPQGVTYTDTLGRQVVFQSDAATANASIRIKGYMGVPDRVISIDWGVIGALTSGVADNLREDFRSLPRPFTSGDYMRTAQGDFPHTILTPHTDLFDGSEGAENIDQRYAVTRVNLLDGRSLRFRYNQYGEVAEVVYPGGGVSRIDYEGFPTTMCDGVSPFRETLDRRAVRRRLFTDGANVDATWTYGRSTGIVGGTSYPTGTIEARRGDGTGGDLLLSETHYFLALKAEFKTCRPLPSTLDFSSDGTHYEKWQNAKEFRVEKLTGMGTQVTVREWQQRAPVVWGNDPGLGYNTYVTSKGQEDITNDTRVAWEETTLENGKKQRAEYGYDQFNNVTSVKEYDFGETSGNVGALLRQTTRAYVSSLNGYCYTNLSGTDGTCGNAPSPDINAIIHQRRLLQNETIKDAGGNQKAYTEFEFDNYASDTNHAALVFNAGMIQYDGARFSLFSGAYQPRGNVTKATRWAGGANNISAFSQYDNAGQVVWSKDPNGNVSTVSFIDNFGNGTNAEPGAGVLGPAGPTFAMASLSTNALGHQAQMQYDYSLGAATGVKDPNGVISKSEYDLIGRPVRMTAALGLAQQNVAEVTYPTASSNVATSSKQLDSTRWLASKTIADGFDRVITGWQAEDGQHASVAGFTISANTAYDALGRVKQVSHPYRPGAGETAIYTTTAYDLAGRVLSVTTPDNAVVTTSYSGNTVTVVDQNGKSRRSVTDGLGRLKEVYEDPSGLNYLTSYSYDTLDNLTTVNQGTQARTFVYDSLKRLSLATNPESGTISYQYDANGNLSTKTDGRGVTSTYVYDALNRNTTVDYSNTNGINPDITRLYDTGANGKGRLRESYAGGSETGGTTVEHTKIMSYDALGRPLDQRQRFKSNSVWSAEYQTGRVYNLAGAVTSQTYPSGRTVSYAYDSAGRLSGFSGNLGDGAARSYSTGIVYSPMGGITKEQFGTDTPVYNKSFYNSRGQLSEIRVSTSFTGPTDTTWNRGAIINHYSDNCWGMCGGTSSTTAMTDNNGNLKKQEVYIPADDQVSSYTTWWQQYDYDAINRLQRVHEYTGNSVVDWQQEYAYDRYGNRTIHQTNTWGAGVNKKDFTVNTANNRLGVPGGQSGTMTYDNAGNLDVDTYSGSALARTYDAENRMTSETQANSNEVGRYTYNADGQRVRRKVNGVETWQTYGVDGELLAEYAAGAAPANPQQEYGYRNGQLLITAEPVTGQPPPLTQQNVTWTNVSSTIQATGNSIQKTSGTNEWDAGAVSTQTIAAGNGYVEFTPGETGTWRMCGLGNGDTGGYYADIEYAFFIYGGGGLSIYESGNDRGSFGSYAAGDRLKVAVENGVVKYYRNATLLYTSTVAPQYPLLVDTSLNTVNAGVYNVVIANNVQNVTWTNVSSTIQATGNSIQKTSGTNEWDAGAVSTQTIAAGNGYVEFTPGETGTWRMCGLGNGDTGGYYADIEYAFFIYGGGGLSIYESGNDRGSFGSYAAGDRLKVAVENGVVKYYRNGTLLYTSTVAPQYPLLVDTSLNTVNAGVYNVVITSTTPSSAGNMYWLVTDQLGTPRLIFDKTGSLAATKRHDYLPFGEELFAGTGGRTTTQGYVGDNVRQKFTRKERDTETGLDYSINRYYSNMQGRFTSPDQLFADQHESDPQSWNLYSYVGNNPINYTDPFGLWKKADCDNGGQCWQSDRADDTYASLAKIIGGSANMLAKYFQNETITLDHVVDVSGFQAWQTASLNSALMSSVDRLPLPMGGGLQNVTRASAGLFSRAASAIGRWFGGGAKTAQVVERTIEIVQREGNLVEMVGKSGQGEIRVLTEMTKQGDTLVLKGLHMEGAGRGSIGVRELFQFARQLGREQGVNKVIIEGAERTTGANPGSIPRTVEIKVN